MDNLKRLKYEEKRRKEATERDDTAWLSVLEAEGPLPSDLLLPKSNFNFDNYRYFISHFKLNHILILHHQNSVSNGNKVLFDTTIEGDSK